jgi:hypothetical protein
MFKQTKTSIPRTKKYLALSSLDKETNFREAKGT